MVIEALVSFFCTIHLWDFFLFGGAFRGRNLDSMHYSALLVWLCIVPATLFRFEYNFDALASGDCFGASELTSRL